MKRILIRFVPAIMLSILLLAIAVTPVLADGLGVGPSVLTITDAVPGTDYFETIFIYNTSNTDGVFLLSGSGNIASWVTFFTMDDNTHANPITQIPIPANGRVYSNVEFSVPANASPLVYQGQLLVTGPPSTVTGPGAHVQIQLPINVNIEMVGAPNIIPTTTTSTFVPTIVSGELNLMSLNYVGQPVAGQLTKLQADLKNLTGADTVAYLTAEVYSGDTLIDTIKSDTLSVPGGGDTTLTTYYKFEKAGNYTIQGQAIYNDKTTQKVTLQLKVNGSGASSIPIIAIIGAVVGVLLVIGLVLFFFNRSRRKIVTKD
jgi:hypothetical protein